MISAISISTADWLPLSAYYPYDANIKIPSTHFTWFDGYTGFSHEAFNKGIDISINRDTVFYLPSSKNLFAFIESVGMDDAYLGANIIIGVKANVHFDCVYQYVTVKDTNLYLNPISSDNSFFRFILNDDKTFSLFQGTGLYVTVDDKTPFNLTMQSYLPENERHRQKFNWNKQDGEIYFTTKTKNPTNLGAQLEERFWSFSKVGPEKGRMRANGILEFNEYLTSDGYYRNNYLFDVIGFGITYSPTGLISEHSWVMYYNEFANKAHNKDVEINSSKSVSSIYINHLFDLPYNTKININEQSMSVNFMNLKNIMTSEYGYRIKPRCACDPYTIGCGIVYNINCPTLCDFIIS